MKTHYLKILMALMLMAANGNVCAQDPALSQYFQAPALFNPAALGDFQGKFRLASGYRSQWSSVTTPYKTTYLGADLALRNAGAGISFIRDGAGEAGLTHLNVLLGFAFRKPVKNGTISVGFQGGLIQKSINPAYLSFDSQYDPDKGFDPSLPSGEFFPTTTHTLPDLGTGLSYHYQPEAPGKLESLIVEASFAHVNRPRFSFLNGEAVLPMRMAFAASADVRTNERVKLSPRFVYMQQGTAQLIQATLGINYELDREVFLDAGLAYRWKDALIPYLGLTFNQLQVGFSYDWTISSLGAYNMGQGAFELSLGYTFGADEVPHSNYTARRERLDSDRDGDGIVDAKDSCPDLAGSRKLKGCPDADGDGLIDPEDNCPTIAGPKESLGCPPQDRDGDGILDSQDACPDQPGLAAFLGCPDSDFDGLPDHVDRCPFQPGPKERAGCPGSDIDADGDGVPDKIDACPTVAGLAEMQGCPDADGDGVSDFEDRCPLQKGDPKFGGCPSTVQDADNDGVADEWDDCPCARGMLPNGCPEVSNQLEPQPRFAERVFGPIEFETDQAIIRPAYYQELNELVRYLAANPEVQVKLEGHTDDEGSNPYNVALAHNRSLAVSKYLQGEGIGPRRFITRSYGEYMPKVMNDTPFGRARNRRVEIQLFE